MPSLLHMYHIIKSEESQIITTAPTPPSTLLHIICKPGILRDKTMNDKFMFTPKDDEQNYPICKLKYNCKWFKCVIVCTPYMNKLWENFILRSFGLLRYSQIN